MFTKRRGLSQVEMTIVGGKPEDVKKLQRSLALAGLAGIDVVEHTWFPAEKRPRPMSIAVAVSGATPEEVEDLRRLLAKLPGAKLV